MEFTRVILIVTDGVGAGKDSLQESQGDKGANTLFSACRSGICRLEYWSQLGLGLIADLSSQASRKVKPRAYVGLIESKSVTKDTVRGHWEIAGYISTKKSVSLCQDYLPNSLFNMIETICRGWRVVYAGCCDGIKAIQDFQAKADLIVYTSPDSTLQIAADETKVSPTKLIDLVTLIRAEISKNRAWDVDRVIARPFLLNRGKIERTYNRKDLTKRPPYNLLNILSEAGVRVIAIGKINDIFNPKTIDFGIKGGSDVENMDLLINQLVKEERERSFYFVNLVQFDSHFGHRRDSEGFAENLNKFDNKLAKLIRILTIEDLLIITSDHGNDPAFRGNNHTRELLPLTIFSRLFKEPTHLKQRLYGLTTVANLVLASFTLEECFDGERLLKSLK